MKKFLIGLIVGGAGVAAAIWFTMPALMLQVHESRYDFDQTVSKIEDAYKASDWKVPHVYDIQKTLISNGYADMTPLKILSVCQPDDAHRILKDDVNKRVTAVMPCRIGVYQAADGKTYISTMNIGLMGRMFGGTIAEVMSEVAKKENAIMKPVFAG